MKAHLVGGGIASLASAVYLIRDGHLPGDAIHLYEESADLGGSLDGQGSPEKGYVIRGGRMFDLEAYTCTYDLLSEIPTLRDPEKTVKQEIFDFNARIKTASRARLVAGGQKAEMNALGLSWRDRADVVRLMALPEDHFGARRIDEHFAPSFFDTAFWLMWCTTFAFQPWHSLVELKRYFHRFLHELPRINTLAGVYRTPYNQYDSIVAPIVAWLRARGVRFETGARVTDLDVALRGAERVIERLHVTRDGARREVPVEDDDVVIVTLGSMTAGSTLGSMTTAPPLDDSKSSGAWALWETLAKKQPDFGRPSAFDDHVGASNFVSFTTTLRDPAFFDFMERFTGNRAGTGGLVTFVDSSWRMSVVLAHQPHFVNQPEGIQVFWGYGLFTDRVGDFVRKPMSACTGEELLRELCGQLRANELLPRLLETSTCIPCRMPYITSQFLPRAKGDRPRVRPRGARNFAFVGQFCEIPDDVVFTVEYSVRTAQTAVYGLLGTERDVAPLYNGERDLRVLGHSARALMTARC